VGVDNKKKKVDDITEQIMGTGSLLKGELELKGRRLVVMPSVKREKVTEVLQNNLLNKSKEGGGQFDKRNMYLRKEGLLNEGLWIHQKPALTSKELEQRQRLYMEKDKALKANPNLSVADKRVQLRNLPRKNFFEAELKELMNAVFKDYFDRNVPADQRKKNWQQPSLKKFCKQVKVMRDGEKTEINATTKEVEKQASGIAYAEFSDHKYALHVVQFLNNMQLTDNRGLIVDFALDDVRKVKQRDAKMDKQQEKAKEIFKEKSNKRKEARKAAADGEQDNAIVDGVMELGGTVYQSGFSKETASAPLKP